MRYPIRFPRFPADPSAWWLRGGLLATCLGSSAVGSLNGWFLAVAVASGLLVGRTAPGWRTAPLVLLLTAVAGAVGVLLIPALTQAGTQFVTAVAAAGLLPWLVGRSWAQSAELVAAGRQRAAHRERERRLLAEQARLRERTRIAAELHDSLGHDLTLLALRAGGLKLARGVDEGHRDAAERIRSDAEAAVERLIQVVRMLREEPPSHADEPPSPADGVPPPLAEPPSPADADPRPAVQNLGPVVQNLGPAVRDLVDRAAASGAKVRLAVVGEPVGTSPAATDVAYRVVREALTNLVRHAPGAAGTVRLSYRPDGVTVRVENGPVPDMSTTGTARRPGGGSGLAGLRERVRTAGGRFAAGPGGSGFAVEARLPYQPAAQGPQTAAPRVDADGVRRRLAVAAVVPLLALGVLAGGLLTWRTYTTAQSVLDPMTFRELRTGLDRSQLRLPEREAPTRPDRSEPSDDGIRCEYYAITGDPLDDRSGDVYRLCFRGTTLVSFDALIA